MDVDFSINDRKETNDLLHKILNELEVLKLGQEITYDDLKDSFEELKEYYFLNKKTWQQLVMGKVMEMVASGVISETASKAIVKIVNDNYKSIIESI